jgi:cytochrome bd-type quinol oxidase subunit 2
MRPWIHRLAQRLAVYAIAVVINLAEGLYLYLRAYGVPARGCTGPCNTAFSLWWVFIFSPAAAALVAIIVVTIRARGGLAWLLTAISLVLAIAVVVVGNSTDQLSQSLQPH